MDANGQTDRATVTINVTPPDSSLFLHLPLETDASDAVGQGNVRGLTNNTYVHFAAVFTSTGGVQQVYIDGKPVGETGSTAFFNYSDVGNFTIGRRATRDSDPRLLLGYLDEFVIFDRALSDNEVQSLWNRSRVVHLKMDESIGSLANDASPNGNDGTLVNANFFPDRVPGVFLSGLDFKGSQQQHIVVNQTDGLPASGDTFTVAYWIKMADWSQPGGMVAAYHANGIRWNIGFKSSEGMMFVEAEFGTNPIGAYDVSNLTNNQWIHMAVVYSPTQGIENVFIDGTPIVEDHNDSFLQSKNGSFMIGARHRNGVTGVHLTAALDDFAIFDHALSLTELQTIRNQGADALVYAADNQGGGGGGAGAAAIAWDEKKHGARWQQLPPTPPRDTRPRETVLPIAWEPALNRKVFDPHRDDRSVAVSRTEKRSDHQRIELLDRIHALEDWYEF